MSQKEKYHITCQYPGCSFRHFESNVSEHYNTVHLQIKQLKCSTCWFETSRQQDLDKHIEAKHLGNDPCRDGDHAGCHWNVSPNKKK